MSDPHSTDKSAAFIGLVVTSVLLFVMVFAIVKLTNAKYAGRQEGAVETTK